MRSPGNILAAVVTLTALACLMAIACACGGNQSSVASLQSSDRSGGQPQHRVAPSIQTAEDVSLDEALAELDAYPTPDGVDAALFAELKSALTAGLTTNNQIPTTARFVSSPPTGDENRVTDLAITDIGGGTYTLSWHYRNLGDYDQNGTVGISDITPIAMHYSETYDVEDVNCLLAVIDGSSNGIVDIADITPIAMNYATDCGGYRIEGGNTVEGTFTSFRVVALDAATGEGRLSFSAGLTSIAYLYLRVVPYDAQGEDGEPSDPVLVPGEPPEVVSVSPLTGLEGESASFLAEINGTPPFTYAWDFGGGADPNTSEQPNPTVTLSAVGEYEASLTVTNVFGEDEYSFTLAVYEPGPSEWWMFGREPMHNRRSPHTGAQSASVKWRYSTGGIIYSSPAVGADGTIYIAVCLYPGTGPHLYAIKPDGTLKWRYDIGHRVYSSPAIGADGTIYIGSWDNYIYAVKPDGTLKWRYDIGDRVYSSPTIGTDGTIYIGSGDYCLYVIKPDGTLKWRYETGGSVYSSPAIGADGTIYVGSHDNYLYVIKPDGTLKWRYETGAWVYSSPAIGADGTIYVGSGDHYFYAVKPDGTLKWRYETGGYVESSPAIGADSTIYVGIDDYDYYLCAIKPDGILKWRYETGGPMYSSPAIGADGTIYVGSGDRYLYAVKPDGTLNWRYETGEWVYSSPAIGADGTIYVGSGDSYLYAFGE